MTAGKGNKFGAMRFKQRPEDFQVEELLRLPQGDGPYAYYRVEKRALAALDLRTALAARLGLAPADVILPALKDAAAVTQQYVSVRGRGPAQVRGAGFVARRVGWGPRPLRPGDLVGNRFMLMVRDLGEAEARTLAEALVRLGQAGLPNYFDEQRFGSRSARGFIGKVILQRDAEQALRLYLSEPMAGDPLPVRTFKQEARAHWGEWTALFEVAPRPSNFRSLLTFLKDHPTDYRKALNLIPARLLALYLAAYQSWVWNQIAGRLLDGAEGQQVEIAGTTLPVSAARPAGPPRLALPAAGVVYPPEQQPAVTAVLAEEGLTLADFKARLLRDAYLPKGEREIWVKPGELVVGASVPDELSPGRHTLPVTFTLPPGSYATLVIKVSAGRCRGTSRDSFFAGPGL